VVIWEKLVGYYLHVKHVFAHGSGQVYYIEFHGGVMFATYEMTIGVNPNCTCPDFMSMLTSLKKRGKFVPCKHMCFIYKIRMFCDHKIDDFIN
jgi:predicted nucleic acid-binding Zn finger protein